MGGGYGDNDNDDGEGSWFNDLLTSLETVQEEYSSVSVFEIDIDHSHHIMEDRNIQLINKLK
jgi:hypothetical protein